MSDRGDSWASSPGVRRGMQANKGRDTKPELALRRELHRRGLRFFVGRRPIPALRRTADILFPRRRVAVFVDGCFWHGCPEHHTVARTNASFWAEKLRANRARDVDTNERLRAEGWTVLRFWEHDEVEHAADVIEAAVRDELITNVPRTPADDHGAAQGSAEVGPAR